MSRMAVRNKIDSAWAALQASYDGLTPEQMLTPGVVGAWSVRDILAHITTWEQEAIAAAAAIRAGKRLPRYSQVYGGIDAFNALMTERKRGLSLDDVLRELAGVHNELLALAATLTAEEAASTSRFYRRLGMDTWRHYPDHTAAIRDWRAREGW